MENGFSSISAGRLRKARIFRKTGAFGVLVVLVVTAIACVWMANQVITIGYEIEGLKKDKDALASVNRALLIERASLTSPDRIDDIARNSIGMRPADDSQMVVVRVVGKGKGASPDPAKRAERSEASPDRS
ncbi:MAG: cell division protein FtsL [Nitrospirae bacterium]|nr:cell division protein FtsL [Nitrospirota bacterium]MBI5696534.1 cell division protein FtsL [Nitrospirota bacterium]